MPYIVFETSTRRIESVYRTLSEASNAVNGIPALSISVERTIDQVRDAEPGKFITTGWEVVNEILDDATVNLRASFWHCHYALVNWRRLIMEAANEGEPWEAIQKAITFLFWQQAAMYHISQSPNYTTGQKIAWANSVRLGASDAENAREFFEVQESLTAPTGPNTWANPANGSRVTLQQSLTLSGSGSGNINIASQTLPSEIHIGGGQWISSLSA